MRRRSLPRVVACAILVSSGMVHGHDPVGVVHSNGPDDTSEVAGCTDWTAIDRRSTAGRIASFFESESLTVDLVLECLEGGADPNAIEQGITPLSAAATRSDDPAIIRALVAAGASDPLALHWAVTNANPEITDVLVEMGADVHARNHAGDTPLHYAVETPNPVTIPRLVEAGADPNARNNRGATPLAYAARLDADLANVDALLRAGADPNCLDDEGVSPLHHAALHATNMDVVEALLAADARAHAADVFGRTPLHNVAVRGVQDENPIGDALVVALFEAGADPNRADHLGQTPLHVAARAGDDPGVVGALIASGAVVDVADDGGRTPIDLAEERGKDSAVLGVLMRQP